MYINTLENQIIEKGREITQRMDGNEVGESGKARGTLDNAHTA